MSQNYPGRKVAPGNSAITLLRPAQPQSAGSGATIDWLVFATWVFLALNVILFWALVGCAIFGRWSLSIHLMISGACPLWVIFGAGYLYIQFWQKRQAAGPT
jgi:hypothetical protein